MKTLTSSLLRSCCLLTLIGSAHAAIVTNGDFGANPIGTGVSSNGGLLFDTTTITDWRVFSAGATPVTQLTASVVDAASGGGTSGAHALRLDVTTGAPAGADYGLDRDSSKVPITFGTNYTFSYDAVLFGLSGGSFTFSVALVEFDSIGNFLTATSFTPTLTGTFQTFTESWTPVNAAATQLNIAFRPITDAGFASASGITNVALVPEPTTVALLGAAGLFCFVMRKRSGRFPSL
jgi:hypothetical protein